MSAFDKKLQDLTMPELTRLIRQSVQREAPPLPASLAHLRDDDEPLIPRNLLTDTIRTAKEGRRVEISPDGICLFDSNEVKLVHLPTDPTEEVMFRGLIEANGISLDGGASGVGIAKSLLVWTEDGDRFGDSEEYGRISVVYSILNDWVFGEWRVSNPVSFANSSITVVQEDAGDGYIKVDSGGVERQVIDNDGESDFAQVSTTGVFKLEHVSVAVDIPSIAAHTGANQNVTIPGLAVGDLCFYLGRDTSSGRQVITVTQPVCTSAGVITIDNFNAHTALVDVPSATFHFLVIHTS